VLWALAFWIGMKSLAGLGSLTRWVSFAVRLVVIAVLSATLAEPQWRHESKDVAVTAIVDVSQSIPVELQKATQRFLQEAKNATKEPNPQLGVVTVAKDAFVQSLPSLRTSKVELQHIGQTDGTNLAAGIRLATAITPENAAYRMVLASDGNDNLGTLLKAAEVAKSMNVPIDVLPLRYSYDAEVLMDRLVTPSTARGGENLTVRIVLYATKDTSGELSLLMGGEPIDLDPASPKTSMPVDLRAGQNVKVVTVPTAPAGAQEFKAVFTPFRDDRGMAVADRVPENNVATSVTFVAGKGRMLVLTESESAAEPILKIMRESGIEFSVKSSAEAPTTLPEWNTYDGVVMLNESAYGFTQKQQEDLRQYIHDTGGGLVMIGGPDSFGAGGWIGSPLEDALPIKLDPPSKRQMPRGALALVIHSCEMPEGVYWGRKVCQAAVNALSRLDYVGINEFSMGGNVWVFPMQQVGDGTKVKRAIQNINFGDMPDFTPPIQMAYDALMKTDAGQRHVIVISDGDPSPPPASLLAKYRQSKITISTVGVFPHSGAQTSNMQYMSKDGTGGNHYEINTQAALAKIPQIFIKEAQTIRRSLIWEGPPFSPTLVGAASEAMRGITRVPPVSGYVVAAERDGLALVTIKGKEGDPIMAQWQHGLGKVVTYTSDATTRWNASWVQWEDFKAFWEQHIRWAMRPAGSANVRVTSETQGDQTLVTLEALDSAGERLNFANFKGRLAAPDGTGADVELRQVAPGRYQAKVPTTSAGSYVMSLRYAAPDPQVKGGVMEGTVQAAISRPFADEYRTLQDNASVLEQVAKATGGRVLDIDQPGAADLWLREGVKFPVTTKPIWLILAIAGMTMFLVDVGIRRVRIDLPAIWRAALGLFAGTKSKGNEQLGSLKSAREQAKKRIMARELSRAEREAAKAQAVAEAATAKVKFEASAEQLKKPISPVAMGGVDAKPEPTQSRAVQDQMKQAQAKPGEGMGRLLQAKKKAREGMDDHP
jgi:uncharacterized membrane protein